MGNRRIGRKRLYGVEKKGQKIELGASAGISDSIGTTTQHRQGQELVTEILVDLNPAAATNAEGGGAGNAIGKSGAAAALTQLTIAKYGIITEIRAVCVEAITDAADAAVDVDVVTSAESTVVNQGAAPTSNKVVVCDGLGVLGSDVSNSNSFNSGMQTSGSEHYLYIVNGDSNTDSANLKTGKLIIYIHGFEVPSDL